MIASIRASVNHVNQTYTHLCPILEAPPCFPESFYPKFEMHPLVL